MLELNPRLISWVFVAGTILLTTYGQLVLKWQIGIPAQAPFTAAQNWHPLILLLLRPWVISAFVAAFGASLCWMLALSHLELSRAYPFMALNFLLVSLLAAPLFGELLTTPKVVGLVTVVAGLVILSRG